MKRLRAIVIVGAVVTAAAACDGSPAMPASDVLALTVAADKWKASEPAAYEYTFYRSCFCPLVTPLRVTVRDEVVVNARIIATGEEITGSRLFWVPTIDEIFAELARVLALPPAHYEARFDALRGFPVEANVDQVARMADDEFGLRLSDFKELP